MATLTPQQEIEREQRRKLEQRWIQFGMNPSNLIAMAAIKKWMTPQEVVRLIESTENYG